MSAILEFILLGFLWETVCLAQYDTFNKPILRMPQDDQGMQTETPEPTPGPPQEPGWVTVLRNNIKKAVHYKGFDNAREDIKTMIQQADEEINGEENKRQRAIQRMRSYVDTGVIEDPKVRSENLGPKWEKDLKKYVKSLIGQYGKAHLDDYVRPVVNEIETTNGVSIKDIDVDPYGGVSITWKYKDNRSQQLRAYPSGIPARPAPQEIPRLPYK